MAWTEPDLNDFLPGEPYTSAKALLQVENPIAIADGDSGAPRIAVSVASAYGTSDFSLAVPAGYSGALFYLEGVGAGDAATKYIRFALSDDNGSSYSTDEDINVGSAAADFNQRLKLFVDFSSGSYTYFGFNDKAAAVGIAGTGTVTTPAGTVDRIIFRVSGADELDRAGVFAQMNGGTAAS